MPTPTLPDGRQLTVSYDDSTENWVAYVAGQDDRSVAGRWLLRVLAELLDLPPGAKPGWVIDLVREVAGHDTPVGRRYACPCCGFFTLAEPPTGTFAICPVCRWEDDNVQFEDLEFAGGANKVSLLQARENFRVHGVSDPARRARARAPRPEEQP